MKMLKKFVLSVLGLSMYAALSITEDNDLYDKFVNTYKLYRGYAGCPTKLCTETQEPKETWTCIPGQICSLPEPKEESLCCSDCSCDSLCEKEGTCCPDRLTNFPQPANYPPGGIYGCHLTSVKEMPQFGQSNRKTISQCDMNFKDNQIITLCEKSDPDSLEHYVPVTHKLTKETYRNKFCAWCNFINDEEIIFWTIHIKCIETQVFLHKSLETIVLELRKHEKCNIIFTPPPDYDAPPPCQTFISSCNQTGKWRQYNSFTEMACSAYSAAFTGSAVTYRNIFCFVCNMNEISLQPETCWADTKSKETVSSIISFGAILNFKEAEKVKDSDQICYGSTVFDHFKNMCREITCPELTDFYNGTCQWLFPKAEGICFEVRFWLSPTDSETTDCESQQEAKQNSSKCIDSLRRQATWDVQNTEEVYKYFSKIFKLLSDYAVNLYAETLVADKTYQYIVVHAKFSQNISFVERILRLDDQKFTVENGTNFTIELWGEQTPFANKKDAMHSTHFLQYRHALPLLLIHPCSKTFTVSKFLHCALITLDLSDFENDNSEITLKSSNKTISTKDFIRLNSSHVNMCADDYLRLLPVEITSSVRTASTSPFFLNLITLACSICSILSLTITITIYIFLPGLRTQPGINNLILSVFLLFAFIFLLFGSMPSLQGTSLLCTVIGLMEHLFWLNSMFWMNICCYHMFKSFGNFSLFPRKLTQKYMAYSLILSFVFVITNIVYSEILSKGQNIGYGKANNFCYIVHARMVLFTMTVPTNTVLVSNLVMYLIVVCRICKLPTVSRSTRKNQSNFSVYVKLSTITGVAWFSYIPVFYTKSFVMEVIFTIIVSLQGVFILLAFVCNRRVIHLLSEKLCNTAAELSPSGTISRKMTKTTSQQSFTDDKTSEADEFITHM